jgi:hypothetical protein
MCERMGEVLLETVGRESMGRSAVRITGDDGTAFVNKEGTMPLHDRVRNDMLKLESNVKGNLALEKNDRCNLLTSVTVEFLRFKEPNLKSQGIHLTSLRTDY